MTKPRAIVLAAGFGTRLRPLTDWIPKPLMPLGHIPLLGHILESMTAAGISNVAVNAHHLAGTIANYVEKPKYSDVVSLFVESEILGTGGPLVNAKSFLSAGDCFLLHNGDILTNLNVRDLIDYHLEGPQKVTMVLLDGPENGLDVEFDDQGKATVNDILGKLGRGHESDRTLTYSGIAVFSKDIFDHLPDQPEFCSVITAILALMRVEPRAVAGYVPKNFVWNDLGTVEKFIEANRAIVDEDSFLRQSASSNAFEFKRLAEHGSNREFYRVGANGETRVLMRSSADDPDFDRFNELGTFFETLALPTPRLDGWNEDNHTVLMEDLGSVTLHDFVHDEPCPGELKRTYGRVIEALVGYQSKASVALPQSDLVIRDFDYDYLRWETDYFRERFLKGHLNVGSDALDELDGELYELAHAALDMPKVFLHRDFQSQNVMLQGDVVRFVDFQGGRWGPYTYDLASLVLDPYVALSEDLRNDLIHTYHRQIVESGAIHVNSDTFKRHFRIAALQRIMQALGAYGFLSHVKGKRSYLKYVAPAVAHLNALLDQGNELPRLRALLKKLR